MSGFPLKARFPLTLFPAVGAVPGLFGRVKKEMWQELPTTLTVFPEMLQDPAYGEGWIPRRTGRNAMEVEEADGDAQV